MKLRTAHFWDTSVGCYSNGVGIRQSANYYEYCRNPKIDRYFDGYISFGRNHVAGGYGVRQVLQICDLVVIARFEKLC